MTVQDTAGDVRPAARSWLQRRRQSNVPDAPPRCNSGGKHARTKRAYLRERCASQHDVTMHWHTAMGHVSVAPNHRLCGHGAYGPHQKPRPWQHVCLDARSAGRVARHKRLLPQAPHSGQYLSCAIVLLMGLHNWALARRVLGLGCAIGVRLNWVRVVRTKRLPIQAARALASRRPALGGWAMPHVI